MFITDFFERRSTHKDKSINSDESSKTAESLMLKIKDVPSACTNDAFSTDETESTFTNDEEQPTSYDNQPSHIHWPPQKILDRIKQIGCHVVPKPSTKELSSFHQKGEKVVFPQFYFCFLTTLREKVHIGISHMEIPYFLVRDPK